MCVVLYVIDLSWLVWECLCCRCGGPKMKKKSSCDAMGYFRADVTDGIWS